MTYARDDFERLPRLPSWVTSARAETLEDVAFLSGAALNQLHLVVRDGNGPQALLRERLALRAAEVCVAHTGRVERAGELRDALVFLAPGDEPGPAGEVYQCWRRAIERPISELALRRALPHRGGETLEAWMAVAQGPPVSRAAAVLARVLSDDARAEGDGLLLADAVLAQALGWRHVVPLLGMGLKRADLRNTGDDLRLACHRTVWVAASEAVREASDLVRRCRRLSEAARRLRAKGADEALALFLSRDAVAPTMLTSLRSDRAARRFCDRLVELGVVRELTGRDTFRLYGV